MVTFELWLLVTVLDSGMLTEAMHVYTPEFIALAEVTVSMLDFCAPLLDSSSAIDTPATLLSNCTWLWYQLRSSDGVMVVGFLAVHVRVKVLNGSTSTPEYDEGTIVTFTTGSIILMKHITHLVNLQMLQYTPITENMYIPTPVAFVT